MNKARLLNGSGLILALVLLIAVNVLANSVLTSSRLDLTEGRLYTLSQGTRNILSKLEEPVTLRLYLSQKLATRLPGLSAYATRVRELLEAYRRAADGALTLHVIDPEPFSEEEDRAVGYGLNGVPIDDEVFYFGLVGTGSTDELEVIPFLSTEREAFLEYDLTKLIHNLSNPERTVVGLLSTLPVDGLGGRAALAGLPVQPWVVVEQLQQLFEVRSLDPEIERVPDDVDVLMLVHPKGLGEQTLYAIDQFVLGGGRALVFLDPYAESEQSDPRSPPPGPGDRASTLSPLLGAWGLALEKGKVVGDLRYAATVRSARDARAVTFEYPVWMRLPPTLFDRHDIVTSDLGEIAFATPGHLSVDESAAAELSPLVSSSEDAMRIDVSRLDLATDPEALLREYRPEGEQFVLAARVSGTVGSAFPDGPPTKPNAADADTLDLDTQDSSSQTQDLDTQGSSSQTTVHLARSNAPINVIVVADTDLLQDRFWVQTQNFLGTRIAIPNASNGAFVTNAVDNLTGSSDLISVRSRGSFIRPFDRVVELRQQAELRYREKEQQLLDRLSETEAKLIELQSSKQADEALILSAAQQQEIQRFREEKVRIRKELRDVRRELRRNIERLEGWLKFINIGLVPILIALGGLTAAYLRLRRRRSPVDAPPAPA